MTRFAWADTAAALPPVNVIQTERHNFVSPAPQAASEHEDGAVAPVFGVIPGARSEDALHLLRRQALGQRRRRPLAEGGHRCFSARSECTTEHQKAAEASHDGGEDLPSPAGGGQGFLPDKIGKDLGA